MTTFRLPNSKCLQTTILDLMKMAESSPNGLKTHWEKEKLLVTSNFSFYHSVFKRVALQTCKHQGLFGKELRVGIYFVKPFSKIHATKLEKECNYFGTEQVILELSTG